MVRTENEVLTHITTWANENDLVRAVILTSSRVHPHRTPDALSDYDIELHVADMEPFQRDDGWLSTFGRIMVRWPLTPRSTWDENWLTRGIHFSDGVRIDFQITAQKQVPPDAYDDGCRVLVDKDGVTANLCEPTYATHLVRKPTRQEYAECINDFWWDATYVPKCLWRDELPFAKSMLDESLRLDFLRRVVEWHIGTQHDWAVNTGKCGSWFKRYLDAETWKQFEATYAGADIEENWVAFFNLVGLFRRLATAVGTELGYEYPTELDEEVTEYFCSIRNMKPADDTV